MAGVDYYDLLGVTPTATPDEVRSAYRRLAKTLHPDAGGNSALFRLVTEAYQALSDPGRRRHYDVDRAPAARESGPVDTAEPPPEQPDAPESTRLSTASLPWWDLVDPHAEVLWLPPFGRWRWPFPLCALAWCVLLGLFLMSQVSAQHHFGFWQWLLIIPVVYVVLATVGWRVPRWLTVVAYLWSAAYAALGLYTIRDEVPAGLWMLALATGPVLLPWLGRHYRGFRAMDRVFTPEFRRMNLFGRPAGGSAVEDEPANRALEQHRLGTQLTARLLAEYLTRMPAVRIFHDLSAPEAPTDGVDHAVLCGHRLVLINSELWEPAHYSIDEFGSVLRDGRPVPAGMRELPEVLAAYRTLLPEVEMQAVVLVHPSKPGELVCSAPLETPVTVLTPLSFLQMVGEWLAVTPTTVDRDAFLAVLGQVRQ